MHAVVFHVDLEPGWETSSEQELDGFEKGMRSRAGFVRATWTSRGNEGLCFALFDSERAAREAADTISVPPESVATLRTAEIQQVVRDTEEELG